MSTAAANTSSENATGPSIIVPSKTEGIALCAAFILTFVFIVVGNLLTIVLFAVNRRLRKRSWFLVINMAFADLMLGTVSLPLYIYNVGNHFELWKGGWSMSLSIFYHVVDMFFSQAAFISAAFISGERFYSIYWPFKHRTNQAYRIITFTVWALTLPITALLGTLGFLLSVKCAVYVWMSYVLIITFIISRWSGDVIERPGHKNFNAVSHNRARPEVMFSNLTRQSQWRISSVLLRLLLSAFSNRKCVRDFAFS